MSKKSKKRRKQLEKAAKTQKTKASSSSDSTLTDAGNIVNTTGEGVSSSYPEEHLHGDADVAQEQEENTEDSDEDGFVHATIVIPTVVGLLKNILTQYPDNGQIIKELVQNAEDAGASEIEIVHDKRPLTAPNVHKKKQKFFKGPALCLYNDGVFCDRDWKGIRMLSDSIKKDDPLKVGQFGLGFKSVFHLTDVVTILSGKNVLLMDPREPEEKMCRFLQLKKLPDHLSVQNCLNLWGSYITEDHFTKDYFPGTIFWFPLRQEPSVISTTIYSPENVEKLFESFENEAHLCLTFLKSLERISVRSKCNDNSEPNLLHKVEISSPILPEIRKKKQALRKQMRECIGTPIQSVVCSYEVTLTNYSLKKGRDEQTISVLHYLQGSDMVNPVVWRGNDSEKHIPLVGVAALKTTRTKGGHIFCFLPLPHESTDSTGLPVNVNGYFVLGQNRRHVKWKTQESSLEPDVQWNEDLVERLIAEAYFLLLQNIIPEVQKGSVSVETWYSLLPDVESTYGRWKQIAEKLWTKLKSTPIIYSEITGNMHKPNEVLCENSLETSSPDVRRAVTYLLSSKKLPLISLPSNVMKSLQAVGSPQSFVTPKVVRETLKQTPSRTEGSQMQLLKFCLSDENCEDLLSLPLLPLENGMWTAFSKNEATVYLCSKNEAAAFVGVEASLVRTSLSSEMQDAFNTIATLGVAQLKMFSLEDHCAELLERSVTFVKENILSREKISNWLVKVWSLLQPLNLRSVENLAVIPTSTSPDSTGLIPLSDAIIEHKYSNPSKKTFRALELLNVKVIAPLPSYIHHHQLKKYINQSDAHGITAALSKVLQKCSIDVVAKHFNSWCSENESQSILSIIEMHNMKPEIENLLKALNIFKATDRNNRMASININRVNRIFPELHDFPVSRPEALIVPRNQTERQLAIKLGAIELSKEEVCLLALEKTYCVSSTKKLCTYIMNDPSLSSQQKIRCRLQNMKFIPSVNGELFMPCQLYDPEDVNVAALIGQDLFPVKEFKKYLHLLRELGLKRVIDMPKNQVIEIARNLQNDRINEYEKHMKSTALLKLIDCHKDCAEICENLMNVPFVYGRSNQPSTYPKNLLWFTTSNLLEPKKAKSYEHYYQVIGSVVHLVDCSAIPNTAKAFGWCEGPAIGQVISHLKNIIDSYRVSDKLYFDLIKRTYSYISNLQSHSLDSLSRLTSVFTEYGFRYPYQVYVQLDADDINLFPYMIPLPYELREYGSLFTALGCFEKQSKELYLEILRQVKDCHDSGHDGIDPNKDRKLVISVLQKLQNYTNELGPSDVVLLPVETCDGRLEMMDKVNCSYSEQACDWLDEEELEVKIVHSSMERDLVKALGVAPLNQHLFAGEQAVLEWGQEEQLTTRLRKLLKQYRDGLSVLKEMVQNADDAKATNVSFMYDQRQNEDAKTRLISEGMKDFQGPALWVYNNAKFTDKDFVNLRHLGGGTKDVTKIGKFGLGFCSVYNLTDLPCFISDSSYVIFDPHMTYLNTKSKSPGVRYDFRSTASNQVMLRKLHGQFKPFENVFGCNLQATKQFDGTLFRLPLRTPSKADISRLSDISYGEKEMLELLKMFYDVIGEILLFTQNVREIEVYLLPENASSPCDKVLLFKSSRRLQRSLLVNENQILNFQLHKTQVEKASAVANARISSSQDVYKESNLIDISVHCTDMGSYLCNTAIVHETVSWIVSWHSGFGASSSQALKEKALSLGAVAVPIKRGNILSPVKLTSLPDGFYKESHIHCFLPLPIKTRLPVHINGFFQVTSDRTSLITGTEDDRSDKLHWNDILLKDAVCAAYLDLMRIFRLEGLDKKCPYYCLWPVKAHDENDHFMSCLTESFFENIVIGNLQVFRRKTNWYSLSECRFLEESFYQIPNVGEAAFEFLKILFSRDNMLTLMVLPYTVVDSFQEKDISCKVINQKNFYHYYFIPNINVPMIETKKKEIISFALDNHIMQPLSGILDRLSTVPCVPVKPYGKLQQPKNTVDPNSQIASLFLIREERFPEESFLKSTMRQEALIEMGMVNERSMTTTMIVERAQSVQMLSCPVCAELRASEILLYIGRQQHETFRKDIVQKIKFVRFLPVMPKPEDWLMTWKGELLPSVHAELCEDHIDVKYGRGQYLSFAEPVNVCSSKVMELAGSISLIFRPLNPQISKDVLKDLGIATRTTDLPLDTVISQLKMYSSEYQEHNSSKLKEVCHKIYEYLEQKLRNQNQKLNLISLKNENVFLTEECGFKNPKLFAVSAKANCPPDLFSVKAEGLSKYPNLLLALDVPQSLAFSTVLEAIEKMKEKYQSVKLTENEVIQMSKLLALLFDEYKADQDLPCLYLPDAKGILLPVSKLCIDDGVGLSSGAFNFLHPKILLSEEMRKVMGIVTKTRKRLEQSSNRLSFGQNVLLTTRIRNIIGEYPCDSQMMKELLQNADDAGATEIAFIKYFRNLPTKRLFDKTWAPLQGPALCIYNNKSFSEEDIKSIQKVGDSKKKEDPASTGQYGIGFNVVYHLTDAPSFITKGSGIPQGETLCLFDPICTHDPMATPESPGVQFVNLKNLRKDHPDSFLGYLEDHFLQEEGTVFRLPLRKEESKISKTVMSPSELSQKLEEFSSEMKSCLLFLKHVRKISIMNMNHEGKCETEYSVEAKVTNEDELKELGEITNSKTFRDQENRKFLYSINLFRACYEMQVTDSDDKSYRWYIVQQLGAENPDSVPDLVKDGFTSQELSLFPHGGCAVLLETNVASDQNSPEFQENEESLCVTSCYLPLPMKSGLPFCVNGHFALSASRRNLWTEMQNAKGQWNSWLMKEVLSPAAAHAVEYYRQYIFSRNISALEEGEYNERIIQYYKLLPDMKMAQSENWKSFTKFFYDFVTKSHFAFFDVFSPVGEKCSGNPEEPSPRMGNLSWHSFADPNSKYSLVFEPEHLNILQELPSTSGDFSDSIATYQEEERSVLDTLRRLGMKIGTDIMHNKLKAAGICHNVIDASFALDFLLSWDSPDLDSCMLLVGRPIEKSQYLTVNNVCLLLRYISNSEEFKSKINNLPLLITADNILRCFDETRPVFATKYWSVTSPKQWPYFVKDTLLEILDSLKSALNFQVKPFTLNDLVRLLPFVLEDQLFQMDSAEIAINEMIYFESSFREFREWLQVLWKFVAEELQNNENVKRYLNDVLGHWTLFPVRINNCSYVINVARAPYVLDAQCRLQDSPFSALPLPYLHEEILCGEEMICIEKIVATLNVATLNNPESLLEALYFHKEKSNKHFEQLQKKNARNLEHSSNILEYFGKSSSLLCVKKLRSLALFEDAAGNLCCLGGHKIIVPNGIHSFQDLVHIFWLKNVIILRRPTSEAVKHLYSHIDEECFMEDLQIFSNLILPNFSELSTKQQSDYLTLLNDKLSNIYNKNSEKWEPYQRIVVGVLQTTPFIYHSGKLKIASDFYDPKNSVFKVMGLVNLPGMWHKKEWRSFMKIAGMKHEITPEMFIQYARSLSMSSSDVQTKSEVLVEYLAKNYEFLKKGVNEIRDIEFIVPHQSENLRKILPYYQTQSGLISFSRSVSMRYEKQVWTACSIYPSLVSFQFYSENFRDLINSEPPPEDKVLRHVSDVCFKVQLGHPAETVFIDKVMDSIYQHLSDAKIQNLHQKLSAKNVPIIHIPKKKTCVNVDSVILSLEQEIIPYLYKAPLRYGRYSKLFESLGVKEIATADNYANVLKSIYDLSKEERLHPEESRKMKIALEGLLKKRTTLKDLSIPNLYLPTSDGKLVKSTEMYVVDKLYYEEFVNASLDRPMFIGFSKLEIEGMNESDFVNLLPTIYRPIVLSDVVEVEFDGDCTEISSPLLEQFRNYCSSKDFMVAILSLIRDEKYKSGKQMTDEEGDQLERDLKNVEIKQLPKIELTLKLNGTMIASRIRQFFIKTFTENANQRKCVYVSETTSERFFTLSLAQAYIELLSLGASSSAILSIILSSFQKPQDIRNILKESDINVYRDKQDIFKLFQTDIGSYLQEDLIHMLDNEFCQFDEKELVSMKKYLHESDEEDENLYIIVQIICQVSVGSSKMLDEYEVKIGNEETSAKRVKSHQLYKFVRPEGSYCNILSVSDGDYPDGNEIFPEMDEKELSEREVMENIREQVKKIWEIEDESEKRHLLRRLMFKWHPDKNPLKIELCTRIIQYMQSLIAKLEKGEDISDVENDTGFGNYSRSEFSENVFRPPPRSFRRPQGFSFSQSEYSETKRPDRSEARKWMQQAQHDLQQAQESEASPCWVTFMCYQAAEKSLMAALYAEDCERACQMEQRKSCSSLVSLADYLSRKMRVLFLCQDISDRVGNHTNILYPDLTGIPINRYDAHDATFMRYKTSQLIDIIVLWI